LQNSILRNRYIPGSNDWYSVIASEMGLNSNAVAQTSRRTGRVFMIDPNLQIGSSNGVLPYTQGTTGVTQPQSPRLMILSSLATALPASGVSRTNFTVLWNTADGSLPANGSFTAWKGQASDLKIQRLDLNASFVKLELGNYLSGTNLGRYKVDGQGPATVTSSGISNYFIRNTVVTLLPDSSSGTNAQAELMLSRDLSFFYVQQVWRDVPYVPDYFSAAQTNASAAGLANMIAIAAANFVVSPFNTNAFVGATPPSVLNAMSNFMYNYVPYAAYGATNNWPTTGALYDAAKNAQTNLVYAMNNLANPNSSGNIAPGGCTNAP